VPLTGTSNVAPFNGAVDTAAAVLRGMGALRWRLKVTTSAVPVAAAPALSDSGTLRLRFAVVVVFLVDGTIAVAATAAEAAAGAGCRSVGLPVAVVAATLVLLLWDSLVSTGKDSKVVGAAAVVLVDCASSDVSSRFEVSDAVSVVAGVVATVAAT
jgi:uncharacterized membrane protein YphA (DoxX/SURF4 family)